MHAQDIDASEREIARLAVEGWCDALAVIASDLEHNRSPSPEHLNRVQEAIRRLQNARALLVD